MPTLYIGNRENFKGANIMRVNMNIGMQNNFLNAHPINQGLNENNFTIKDSEQQELKDTVFISPLGKARSLIESLTKQKQNIIESKNELIGKTLEKGGTIDSIKSQLECFDEQLKTIDEQIAQTVAEQLKQQAEKQKEIAYKKPKTEEEVETEHLSSILSLSSSLNQAEVVSSMKSKVDGESRVLKMEIKLDESRRGGASAFKKEHLVDLQKQSVDLATKINENLTEVSEEIKNGNDNEAIKPKNSETKHKSESTDSDNIVHKVKDTDSDEK